MPQLQTGDKFQESIQTRWYISSIKPEVKEDNIVIQPSEYILFPINEDDSITESPYYYETSYVDAMIASEDWFLIT